MYTDEGDELFIMDINDLWAAFESAKGQTLKVTAKIENFEIPQIESEEDEAPRIELDVDVSPDQFEEIKKSINQISKEMNLGGDESSDDDEKLEEEKQASGDHQMFKDFRFADVFTKVEDVINTQEKVKLRDIFNAVEQACTGTHAEKVARKFVRKFKKAHCGGPIKGIMKMLHKAAKKKHNKRNADEAHMPNAKRQERRQRCAFEEEKRDQPEEPFKYQTVLDVLTKELGIDAVKAKEALMKHEGNFDLACSTASKDAPMPAEQEKPRQKK